MVSGLFKQEESRLNLNKPHIELLHKGKYGALPTFTL